MQGTIAKLTVVAGVVGIGLLTLLQVNGVIQNTQSSAPAEEVDDLAFDDELDAISDESPTETAPSSPPLGQSEPADDDDENWETELLNGQETVQANADDDEVGLFDPPGNSKSRPPSPSKVAPLDFEDGELEQFADTDEDLTGDAISLNSTADAPMDEDDFSIDDAQDDEVDPSLASTDETAADETANHQTAELKINRELADTSGVQVVNGSTPATSQPSFDGDETDDGDEGGFTEILTDTDEQGESGPADENESSGPKFFAPGDDDGTDEIEDAPSTKRTVGDDSPLPATKAPFDKITVDESDSPFNTPPPQETETEAEPGRLSVDNSAQPLTANQRSTDANGLESNLRSAKKSPRPAKIDVIHQDDDPFAADDSQMPSTASDTDGSDHEEPRPASSDDSSVESETPPSATPQEPVSGSAQPALSGTKSLSGNPSLDASDELLLPPQKIPSRKSDAKPALTISETPDLQGDATVDQSVPQGVSRPQLTIEKIAPKNAVLGQPMVYQILVKNQGDAAAHQVVVEDRIPLGSQLSGTDPQAVLSDRKLVWDLGTLEAGAEQTIAVRVVPTSEGSIGSVATVNFVAEITAETMITAPKLELELTGPQTVDVGKTVELHFKLTNMGNSTADGVFIREVIPAGFEHPAGDDLEYEVGGLSPGQSREVHLKLKAVQPGNYTNTAVAMAEGGWEVETKLDINILGPQLTISRSGPKRRTIGRSATYSNTIENDGDQIIRDVSIEEALPEGMEFVEATDGGQYNEQGRVVIWRLDELPPSGSHTVSVVLTPRCTRGAMESTVRVIDSRGIPVEVQSLTDVVGHPSLSIDSTALDGPINVGEDVGFRVQIRNRGTAPATNVDVRMTIPPGLKFIAARGLTQDNATEKQVHFVPVERLDAQKDLEFELVFRSIEPGDSRVKIDVKTDQMQRPLSREEAVVIFSDEK